VSPPRGRYPTTRSEWIQFWAIAVALPLVGWVVLGVPGLFGGGWLSLGLVSLTGAQWALRKRQIAMAAKKR